MALLRTVIPNPYLPSPIPCAESALATLLAAYWYVTCTATQSSEKSREVLLATSITRTRKLVFDKSLVVQVRPHVSVALPRM